MVEAAVLDSSLFMWIVGDDDSAFTIGALRSVSLSVCRPSYSRNCDSWLGLSVNHFVIIGGVCQHRSANHSLTDTDASVQTHRHPGHALTAEWTLRVDAATVHAHSRGLAFVGVWARERERVRSFLRDNPLHTINVERQESMKVNQFPASSTY